MNESSPPTSNPLDAIMAEFLLAQERGENPDRQQFLRMHAEQANELAARFDHMDRLAATMAKPNPPDPTVISLNDAQPGMLIVGRYKLIEPIGQGGMGSVWVAEQKEPVKRRVAVKLIKAGMDSREVLARFEAERQALAMMDHTNIARVFDGGMTEQGRPFFVMELVKGIPLTEYCDQVQLTVTERLELFSQVCSAVQHAHQKGIIHRDLKPTNILVTEYDGRPVCKVIDFGLAKALHGNHTLTDLSMHTAFGAVVGTPLYMAPEQLGTSALDVDTRADLYSLGVILYELLTGATPIERQRLKQAAWDEVRRIVREEEPPIPSHRLSSSGHVPRRSPAGDSVIPPRSDRAQLSNLDITARNRRIEPAKLTKLVRGDLDWIVMKSLEKDRNRRYETANGLSLDIQRYLTGEAVLAAPPSRSYRLRKFIRKHRTPVIAASVVSLSLIAGIIGTSIGFYKANQSANAERLAKLDAQKKQAEAERQRIVAESQRKRAEQREQDAIFAVKNFADSVNNSPELKNNPSLDSLRKMLLQKPLAFFASLYERLQSDSDTAPESLNLLAMAATELGYLTWEIGNRENALRAYEQALTIWEELARENPTVIEYQSGLATAYYSIGAVLSQTGKTKEALKAYAQALEIQRRHARDNPTVTQYQSDCARTLNDIGANLNTTGDVSGSLNAFEHSLEIRERLVANNPAMTDFQSNLAWTRSSIGSVLQKMGRSVEALKAFESSFEIRKVLARDNPSVTDFQHALAQSHYDIWTMLSTTGDSIGAFKAHEQALKIQERLVRDNPSVTDFQSALAWSHDAKGALLSVTGDPTGALKSFEQALEIRGRLACDNPSVADFQSALARGHYAIGALHSQTSEFAEGLKSHQQALEIRERLAEDYPTVTQYQRDLSVSHIAIGELLSQTDTSAEGLKSYQKALEIQERLVRDNPTMTGFQCGLAATYHNIGNAQRETGNFTEAQKSLEQALEIQERLASDNPTLPRLQSDLAASHYAIGVLRTAMSDSTGALKAFEDSLEVRERLAHDNLTVTRYQTDLSNSHNAIGALLSETGKPADGMKSYQKALEIQERLASENPAVADYQSKAGVTLNNIALLDIQALHYAVARDRLKKAIEYQKQAIARISANSMYRQFLKSHYEDLQITANALSDRELYTEAIGGLAEAARTDPQNAAKEERFQVITAGASTNDGKELVGLGTHGYETFRFRTAVRFFENGLKLEPELAENRTKSHAYNAACCAALAASRQSIGESEPDDAAKEKLRTQALTWLQEELQRWTTFLESASVEQKAVVVTALKHWQQDADLTSIRDADELAKIPEPERLAFDALWKSVDELLQKASTVPSNDAK